MSLMSVNMEYIIDTAINEAINENLTSYEDIEDYVVDYIKAVFNLRDDYYYHPDIVMNIIKDKLCNLGITKTNNVYYVTYRMEINNNGNSSSSSSLSSLSSSCGGVSSELNNDIGVECLHDHASFQTDGNYVSNTMTQIANVLTMIDDFRHFSIDNEIYDDHNGYNNDDHNGYNNDDYNGINVNFDDVKVTIDKNEIGKICEKKYKDCESSSTQTQCIICLCDYDQEDIIRILQCNHIFHKDCIDKWLLNEKTYCPICRQEVKLKHKITL